MKEVFKNQMEKSIKTEKKMVRFHEVSAKEKIDNYGAIDLFEDIITLLLYKNSPHKDRFSLESLKTKTPCCFC